MIRAGALAVLLIAGVASHAAPAADGVRLGGSLEKAFRACALQTTRLTYLTDQAMATERTAVGITSVDALPDGYENGIARDNRGTPTLAKMETPDGPLWLIGYAGVPFCKVLIGDNGVTPAARAEFERRFAATSSWTKDPASRTEGPLSVQLFTLNAARPGPHMIVKLEGPSAVFQDGRGIQAIMTVAIIKPEAQ